MRIIFFYFFLFVVNLSYCQIANENATVVLTWSNPDPEAHLNAFLDKLKEGYKYKLYEHVPHGDLDFIPQPLLSGGYLFVALSLWLTVAFSCAMCGFIYCVKDHYKRRDPITVIV